MNIVRFTITFDLDNPHDWSVGDVPDNRHDEVQKKFGFILSRMLYDTLSPGEGKHIVVRDNT